MARASGASQLYAVASPTPLASCAEPVSLDEQQAYQHQLVEAYLTSRRIACANTTMHGTRSALLGNLLPWLEREGRFVWEVTPADLDRWALALKHSVKARTHQGYFAQVALFYDWLVTRHADQIETRFGVELRRSPVDRFNRVRRLPEDERLVPVPREEVITYFLAICRASIETAASDSKWLQACRNYTLWMTLNWAGLRRAEATRLTRQDLDLVAGTLRVVEGKGGKGRLVHIQPPLAPILRWYLQDVRTQVPHGERTPLLFTNGRLSALHPNGVANLLRAQQVATGLPEEGRFGCHGFRRAYATRLYKALRAQRFRDPLVYVKEQLGHDYVSTTQRYCQLDDDYRYFLVREASEALTQHYGTPSGHGSPRSGGSGGERDDGQACAGASSQGIHDEPDDLDDPDGPRD